MHTSLRSLSFKKVLLGLAVTATLGVASQGTIKVVNAFGETGVTSLPTQQQTHDVAMTNYFAYVGDQTGITTISLVNSSNPYITSTTVVGSPSYGVEIESSTLYSTNDTAGLLSYSLTNPRKPKLSYTIDTPGTASGSDIIGTTAYVADGYAGLTIVDLSQKKVLRTINTNGYSADVVVNGNYAYVADDTGGVVVVDLTTNTIVRTMTAHGFPRSIAVKDNVLYVSATSYGLMTYTLENPTSPAYLSSLLNDQARDITIDGDYAFLSLYTHYSQYQGGYYKIDITNPADLSDVYPENTQPYGLGIGAKNGFTVLANGTNGVTVRSGAY